MKRNRAGAMVFLAGFLVCFLFGTAYALGFAAGGCVSGISFCILKLCLGGGTPGVIRPSRYYIIALGGRVILSAVLLSLSIMAGAHPLGIFAGITCALCMQVFSLTGMLQRQIC